MTFSTASDLFYRQREILHFQLVFFFCDVLDAVVGRQGTTVLCNDLTTVTNGRHVMNRHARLALTGSLDSLVHMVAPHALAAKLGQQRRVQIDNTAREGSNEVVGK